MENNKLFHVLTTLKLLFPYPVYLHALKAAAWGSGFNQPESRWGLRFPHFRTLTGLAHPQLLGATKNEIGCPDNHKGLKDNQGVGQSWMIRFISYTEPLLQNWKRWLFHPMCRNQHKVKQRNMFKQMTMFPTKELNNISRKKPCEMEMSNLLLCQFS